MCFYRAEKSGKPKDPFIFEPYLQVYSDSGKRGIPGVQSRQRVWARKVSSQTAGGIVFHAWLICPIAPDLELAGNFNSIFTVPARYHVIS